MTKTRIFRNSTLALVLATSVLHAEDSAAVKRNTWNEFSARVTSRSAIRIVLPDATWIEGEPLVPIFVGSYLFLTADHEVYRYLAAAGAIAGIGGTIGFFAGRAIDQRFEKFIIIPERQP